MNCLPYILFVISLLLSKRADKIRLTFSFLYSTHLCNFFYCEIKTIALRKLYYTKIEGARAVMVIVVGNEHGDTSSNPGRDWLHFT